LFTQVLKQPFSITNMVLEISPSSKSVVRAGTSNRWKRCSNFSHLFVFIASDLYRQQFFTFPKKRWVNQYQAKNSRNNDKLQEVMRSHKVLFLVCFPEKNQEKQQPNKTEIEIDIHIAYIGNFDQNINRNQTKYNQKRNDIF